MKTTFLTLVGSILTIFIQSCVGATSQGEPFHGVPFIAKGSEASLPDSLGGKGLKGYVALKLMIDTSGVIHSFKILRFRASDSISNLTIDYRLGEKHDTGVVNKYHDWLSNYVDGIVITRNPRHFDFWEKFFSDKVKAGNIPETFVIRFGG